MTPVAEPRMPFGFVLAGPSTAVRIPGPPWLTPVQKPCEKFLKKGAPLRYGFVPGGPYNRRSYTGTPWLTPVQKPCEKFLKKGAPLRDGFLPGGSATTIPNNGWVRRTRSKKFRFDPVLHAFLLFLLDKMHVVCFKVFSNNFFGTFFYANFFPMHFYLFYLFIYFTLHRSLKHQYRTGPVPSRKI